MTNTMWPNFEKELEEMEAQVHLDENLYWNSLSEEDKTFMEKHYQADAERDAGILPEVIYNNYLIKANSRCLWYADAPVGVLKAWREKYRRRLNL